jgi:AraC family transcriptional regulator
MGSPRFRSVDLERLRVTEAAFPAGITLAMHRHADAILAVMLAGGFDLTFPRRHFDCPPGTIFVEPGGERHANRLGTLGAVVVVLEIPDSFAWDDLRAGAALLDEPRCIQRPEVLRLAHRLQREIRAADSASPFAVDALAGELLAAASGRTERDSDARSAGWVSAVRDQLHENLDRPLRLMDLAREVGVHRVHLGRVFRARYGESLGAYHRRVRVEWAAAQLLLDDCRIGDIAARAGFADQAHFTRVFKRIMGATPLVYSERQRRRFVGVAGHGPR